MLEKIIRLIKNIFYGEDNLLSLTIIGVGPGDPSLLTIAAVRAIEKSQVIFYPISADYKNSIAGEIVKPYIKFKKRIPIVFPMARKEFDSNEVWRSAAEKIIYSVNKKKSVALLCLGDTSIYASSTYIINEIKRTYPEIQINIIPGISSLSLAAALSDFQLINSGEKLEVFECPEDADELTNLINDKKKTVLAIMKVGKRWKWVKEVLIRNSLFSEVTLAVNLGFANQFIGAASDYIEKELPYFSLILIRLK